MANPFSEALDADPTDADLRRVYADWLEEGGNPTAAAFQRWLARKPGLIRNGDTDPQSMCASCVIVDMDALPDGVRDGLPPPQINCDGGPESEGGERVLLDLWATREACERDLFDSWRSWAATPESLPLFAVLDARRPASGP